MFSIIFKLLKIYWGSFFPFSSYSLDVPSRYTVLSLLSPSKENLHLLFHRSWFPPLLLYSLFTNSFLMSSLQRHSNKNSKQIFPEKLRSLRPNSYIHVSVSDYYIPTIGMPILLQENRCTDCGNIWIAHRHMNEEIGTEATQLLFWK